MKKLLLIEDDPIMGESLQQRFDLEGFAVTWCRRLHDAVGKFGQPWSVVISDVRLPDGLATEWFVQQAPAIRSVPWFFLTGYGSVNDAVEAMRAGAREYLTKPFDVERLVSAVKGCCAAEIADDADAVLGVSPAMRRVEKLLRRIAAQRVSVLITGESGVGKEVAAQLLHSIDPAASTNAFVAVNCAAVPESMLEAEFFGYEKGAFTGAQRAHRGYLERADGGTLFLDEVGDLPANMQAKLLRALQERCFFRLGSEKTTHSNFRLIAATNQDLHAKMVDGSFREDLFYRLAVIKVELPPLRDRPEDIRWLTERMLQLIAAEQGRTLAVSESFLRHVLGRHWKGNARELRSYLEQSVALSDEGVLDEPEGDNQPSTTAHGGLVPLRAMLEETERRHIRRAIESTKGSVSRSAELLGISRKTLWEKMKKLEITTPTSAEV